MSIRIAALIAAVITALGTTAIVSAPPASACPSGYYKASSGDCVHRPICGVTTQPPVPPPCAGTAAGRFSENPTEDDTCHGHQGTQKVLSS